MSKNKLALHRETLRRLGSADLRRIGVATGDAQGTQTIAAEVSRPPVCPVRPTLHACPVG